MANVTLMLSCPQCKGQYSTEKSFASHWNKKHRQQHGNNPGPGPPVQARAERDLVPCSWQFKILGDIRDPNANPVYLMNIMQLRPESFNSCRVTKDSRFSLIDCVALNNTGGNITAAQTLLTNNITRLLESSPILKMGLDSWQFPGARQVPTPVADFATMMAMLLLLPGANSDILRKEQAEIATRVLSGDPDVMAATMNQLVSLDPAYRALLMTGLKQSQHAAQELKDGREQLVHLQQEAMDDEEPLAEKLAERDAVLQESEELKNLKAQDRVAELTNELSTAQKKIKEFAFMKTLQVNQLKSSHKDHLQSKLLDAQRAAAAAFGASDTAKMTAEETKQFFDGSATRKTLLMARAPAFSILHDISYMVVAQCNVDGPTNETRLQRVCAAVAAIMNADLDNVRANVNMKCSKNHIFLYQQLCRFAKARLPEDAEYSTEMPMAHVYIYAKNLNKYMLPHGYLGSHLEAYVLALQPDVSTFTLDKSNGVQPQAPAKKPVDNKQLAINLFFKSAVVPNAINVYMHDANDSDVDMDEYGPAS